MKSPFGVCLASNLPLPERIDWTIKRGHDYSGPCPFTGGHDRLNQFGDLGTPGCRRWCRICGGFQFIDGGVQGPVAQKIYRVPDAPAIPQSLAADYHAKLPGYAYFESRGISKEWADRAMLGYCPQKNAWTIPIFYGGMLYGMQYRSAEKNPKYRYWSEKGSFNNLLYGAAWVQNSVYVVIVEGALDSLALNSFGIPAVATPAANNSGKNGQGSWEPEWNNYFPKAIDKVIVSDYDLPGRRIAEAKQKKIPGSRIVTLPLKDAGEMFKAGRQDELPDLLRLPRRIHA